MARPRTEISASTEGGELHDEAGEGRSASRRRREEAAAEGDGRRRRRSGVRRWQLRGRGGERGGEGRWEEVAVEGEARSVSRQRWEEIRLVEKGCDQFEDSDVLG
ncbi:hypothetical protein E2562_032085 [Oryza meyeriana var. granulata]|uniref:Uncharacterized protein n=1 Tax=Oryza meyeriana var. granulata TaxID=110450 RepID=A0A6G1CKA2_9ORYZ|nr:hypothetical protein E2562_032085 [Oryza meyeriana var. granulata]